MAAQPTLAAISDAVCSGGGRKATCFQRDNIRRVASSPLRVANRRAKENGLVSGQKEAGSCCFEAFHLPRDGELFELSRNSWDNCSTLVRLLYTGRFRSVLAVPQGKLR
jgi:hypothetical protein